MIMYWAGFGFLLVAVLALLMGGITRTLGAGYSLAAIALALVALALGVASLRR
jgi:hypothetical protein